MEMGSSRALCLRRVGRLLPVLNAALPCRSTGCDQSIDVCALDGPEQSSQNLLALRVCRCLLR